MTRNVAKSETEWKSDLTLAANHYNNWFKQSCPRVFRDSRTNANEFVNRLFLKSKNLTQLDWKVLKQSPELIRVLRLMCSPPIANDRLAVLSGISSASLKTMQDKNKIPTSITDESLIKIMKQILELLDSHVFDWVSSKELPNSSTLDISRAIILDRLSLSISDPRIRNMQERRQEDLLAPFLIRNGYNDVSNGNVEPLAMEQYTFQFRKVIKGSHEGGKSSNVPVD
jgi:hypothetical protein